MGTQEQKTAFINGGARGIGAAFVRLFARNGYRVAFTYRRSHEEAMALTAETGALAICADSADEESVRSAAEQVLHTLGAPYALINNAALSFIKLFQDVTAEEWDQMWRTNVNGAMGYIQAFLPHMIAKKRGRIINVSSMWGQVGASCEVHYSVTKAALIGLTRALAKEVGPSGITVNAIAPGVIRTDMNAALPEETLALLREETPLGRLGTAEDVAKAAYFLAEDGGDFITGQVISPNGGLVIG